MSRTTRSTRARRGEARTPRLSHVDADGAARMVDVTAKPVSAREAVARGRIRIAAPALRLVREGLVKKGDVLQVARLAGIMAAKQTASLIPLCHPLPLSGVDIDAGAAARRLRDPGDGPNHRADRRRNGSAHGGIGDRPHHLRHGESGRQDDDDLGHRARVEARRQVGRFPARRARQALRDRVHHARRHPATHRRTVRAAGSPAPLPRRWRSGLVDRVVSRHRPQRESRPRRAGDPSRRSRRDHVREPARMADCRSRRFSRRARSRCRSIRRSPPRRRLTSSPIPGLGSRSSRTRRKRPRCRRCGTWFQPSNQSS